MPDKISPPRVWHKKGRNLVCHPAYGFEPSSEHIIKCYQVCDYDGTLSKFIMNAAVYF